MTPEQAPLSTGQVAAKFGVAPNTVRRWAEEKKIRSFLTPSGQLRFPPDVVAATAPSDESAEAVAS